MPTTALTLSSLSGPFTNLAYLTTDDTVESVANSAANGQLQISFNTNAASVVPAGNVITGVTVTIKGGLPSGQTTGNKIEFVSGISMPAVNLTAVQSVFTRGSSSDPMGVTDKSQLASLVLRFTAGPQLTTWYMRYIGITITYDVPPDPTIIVRDVYPNAIIYTDSITTAEFTKAMSNTGTEGVYTGSVPVNGAIGANVRLPMSTYLPANAELVDLTFYSYLRANTAGRRRWGILKLYNPADPSSIWEANVPLTTSSAWYPYTLTAAELTSLGWTVAKLRDDANNEWYFGVISTNATSTTLYWAYAMVRVRYRLPAAAATNTLFFGENF